MKHSIRITIVGVTAALLLAVPSSAALIDITLGEKDYDDGVSVFPFAFNLASAGEPVPFNAFQGSDLGVDFSAVWSFNYLFAPLDVVVAASIEFGLLDHDSAASGSQLASFDVDGNSLTSSLDPLLEAAAGANNQYNIFTVLLPPSAFSALEDGVATFSLSLKGPGLGILGETSNNGAGLDFARLRIESRPGNGQVPEPATALTVLLGAAGLVLRSRRRR